MPADPVGRRPAKTVRRRVPARRGVVNYAYTAVLFPIEHQCPDLVPFDGGSCYRRDMEQQHGAVAILPTHDLDESQAFFERLGFALASRYDAHGYRILRDPAGASVHLTKVDRGWVDADRNAHGVYFYSKDVEALAAEFAMLRIRSRGDYANSPCPTRRGRSSASAGRTSSPPPGRRRRFPPLPP